MRYCIVDLKRNVGSNIKNLEHEIQACLVVWSVLVASSTHTMLLLTRHVNLGGAGTDLIDIHEKNQPSP